MLPWKGLEDKGPKPWVLDLALNDLKPFGEGWVGIHYFDSNPMLAAKKPGFWDV